MSNNNKIKPELDIPVSSAKLKFTPKVPVKKAIKVEDIVVVSEIKVEPGIKKKEWKDKKQWNNDRNDRGGRGDRDGGRGGGRGGRGGRWVMPIGQAFFTGSNSSSITNNSTRPAVNVSTENKKPTIGVKVKKSSIDDKDDKGDKNNKDSKIEMNDIVVEKVVVEEDLSYLYDKEYDSDSDIDENDTNDDDSHWPPEDYDPMSPLSLPIGPVTAAVRDRIAHQPILAQPDDFAALEKEAMSNVFLLQMPSDLRIESKGSLSQSNTSEAVDYKENEPKPTISPGKIGKLQLLKSGRVILITTNGLKYDVNNGMATCFSQYLFSLDIDLSEEAKKASAAAATCNTNQTLPSSSSSAYSRQNIKPSQPVIPITGKLCMLDRISRKLIITPQYDIGKMRNVKVESKVSIDRSNNEDIEMSGEVDEYEEDDVIDIY